MWYGVHELLVCLEAVSVHSFSFLVEGNREGFLWKRGRDNAQFLRRRFVLLAREGLLKYYTKEEVSLVLLLPERWLSPHSGLHFYLFLKFLAALGLHCCTRAFSSCGEGGLHLVVVRGLLIVVASLVAEHGL